MRKISQTKNRLKSPIFKKIAINRRLLFHFVFLNINKNQKNFLNSKIADFQKIAKIGQNLKISELHIFKKSPKIAYCCLISNNHCNLTIAKIAEIALITRGHGSERNFSLVMCKSDYKITYIRYISSDSKPW